MDPNSQEPLIKWIYFSALAFPSLVLRLLNSISSYPCYPRPLMIRRPFKVANYEKNIKLCLLYYTRVNPKAY